MFILGFCHFFKRSCWANQEAFGPAPRQACIGTKSITGYWFQFCKLTKQTTSFLQNWFFDFLIISLFQILQWHLLQSVPEREPLFLPVFLPTFWSPEKCHIMLSWQVFFSCCPCNYSRTRLMWSLCVTLKVIILTEW